MDKCYALKNFSITAHPETIYLTVVDRDLNAVKSTPKTNVFAGNKSNQILKAPTI